MLVDVGDYKAMTTFERRFIDLTKPIYVKEDGVWKIVDVKNKSIFETKFQTIRKNRDKLFAIINYKLVLINESGKVLDKNNK